jgi:hypothetical protein
MAKYIIMALLVVTLLATSYGLWEKSKVAEEKARILTEEKTALQKSLAEAQRNVTAAQEAQVAIQSSADKLAKLLLETSDSNCIIGGNDAQIFDTIFSDFNAHGVLQSNVSGDNSKPATKKVLSTAGKASNANKFYTTKIIRDNTIRLMEYIEGIEGGTLACFNAD